MIGGDDRQVGWCSCSWRASFSCALADEVGMLVVGDEVGCCRAAGGGEAGCCRSVLVVVVVVVAA